MDWKPSEKLIAWGTEHLAAIPVEGIWAPEGSGVKYRKMTDKTFALVFMYNHPEAEEHHMKFTLLMEACDYIVIEGDGAQKITPKLNPEAQMQDEYEQKQAIARNWTCPICEFPLSNCELDEREDIFIELKEVELSNGEHSEVELWKCVIQCAGCEEPIDIEPDDYQLLAGDEYFMRWRTGGYQFMALTRGQMKDMADAGVLNGQVLGSNLEGERVPPWMWGIYTIKREL
jgi:hypothetical protein